MRKLTLCAALVLAGCGRPAASGLNLKQFLEMYNDGYQRLYTKMQDAEWLASTDVNDLHTGQRIGAVSAFAAFKGSPYVINTARAFLARRPELTDLEFRQLDKILLNAAESPGTIPELVDQRIALEAKLGATLDSFTFCLERRGETCARPVTPNQIDDGLRTLTDAGERRKLWEASKQSGVALRDDLLRVRDLRNRTAAELGYTSFFHLEVADYGMSVREMMALMDKAVADTRPLYEQLHAYARRKLAARYKQPEPGVVPAHWAPNRWAQEWSGLVEAANLDPYFKGRKPQWIVEQAGKFYVSLGFPELSKSFWDKSDLFALPPGATRKKNTHASAWHMNLDQDVRSLMSVEADQYWFETAHHELGHVYYFLSYSTPRVPLLLREGANRAFHEAVGDLIAIAARQQQYLRGAGVLPPGKTFDKTQLLLAEALDGAVMFVPFGAGTMSHFEHDLYEKRLPAAELNKRWWQYARQFQGIEPPAARGETYCDACTKTHIIDDPAQYYDYAMAFLIKYQLHDYIARKILKQDPRDCNYYGNKEVGRFLSEILSLGATRDWRQVLREKTGEELSSRAMLEYFQPLVEYLKSENAGATPGWQ